MVLATYSLPDLNTGQYRRLLTAALEWCTHSYLVVRPELQMETGAQLLLSQLQPHLESQVDTQAWPGTELLGVSVATVYTYRLNETVLAALLGATSSLFDWRQPELPEDLGLTVGGTPWLVSISHERDAWINATAEQIATLRSRLPDLQISGDE